MYTNNISNSSTSAIAKKIKLKCFTSAVEASNQIDKQCIQPGVFKATFDEQVPTHEAFAYLSNNNMSAVSILAYKTHVCSLQQTDIAEETVELQLTRNAVELMDEVKITGATIITEIKFITFEFIRMKHLLRDFGQERCFIRSTIFSTVTPKLKKYQLNSSNGVNAVTSKRSKVKKEVNVSPSLFTSATLKRKALIDLCTAPSTPSYTTIDLNKLPSTFSNASADLSKVPSTSSFQGVDLNKLPSSSSNTSANLSKVRSTSLCTSTNINSNNQPSNSPSRSPTTTSTSNRNYDFMKDLFLGKQDDLDKNNGKKEADEDELFISNDKEEAEMVPSNDNVLEQWRNSNKSAMTSRYTPGHTKKRTRPNNQSIQPAHQMSTSSNQFVNKRQKVRSNYRLFEENL